MFSGAKGGGSSAFKQTPDNLRSNDTFEGVLGLCIGPIKGPVRGLKSIKLDGTAIENETGQLNFDGFSAPFGDGDPLKFPQRVQLKLGAGAAPSQVGLPLTNPNGTSTNWVTRTMTNRNADFVDLRFIAQQLFRQDAKGIYNATATIQIQMKPVGSSTWVNPAIGTSSVTYNQNGLATTGVNGSQFRTLVPQSYFDNNGAAYPGAQNYAITGKTSSPAVYELRIGLPNEGSYKDVAWDIRARLIERDSYTGGKDNADQERRSITWESLAAVYSTVMGEHEDWRGVAWLQLYGKASDSLSGVPEVTGVYDTKIVSVPAAAVYDPTTRQYRAGVWDGSWAKAFTTDPAWIINDAISDELAGLSLIARGSFLNKWDALELSKHCSTLVPDGNGGTHVRYNMNIAISQPQKAEEMIRYLAGAVGALAWDQGDGEWRVKVDKADSPVDIFTLDNIEDQFVYAHTDVDTRFNDIIGKFKNEEMDYREDGVQLFDNESIAKIGRKPTTIALVGCTNRQEAMRRVKLRIRSTVNENRIVNFTTNRRGRNIEPLDTILIADGDLGDQDKRTTGRVLSVSADRLSITLRDTLYVAPGVSYKLWFSMPNPGYNPDTATQPGSADWLKPTIAVSRNVTNTSSQRGPVKTIYLDQALPADVADLLSVSLEASTLVTMPRLFRVTNVMVQEDGERIAISAINIDTGKWAASDNVTKADTVFQDLRGAVPPPTLITGTSLLSLVRIPIEQGSQVNLQASWVRPAGAFISGFRVQYSVNGGALQTAVERQQLSTWELPNASPGTYRVEVCTMDRRGGYSAPLVGVLEVTQTLIDATEIKYNGGETLESLKPAEPGADPTGQHTSKDTNAVGGRPSGDVLLEVDRSKERLNTLDTVTIPAVNAAIKKANDAITQANTDATAAVKLTNDKLDAAVLRLDGEDTNIKRSVETVTTNYKAADVVIDGRITREVKSLTDADVSINQRIDTVVGEYRGLNTTTNTRITTEVSTLNSADEALGRRIDTVSASSTGAGGNLLSNSDFLPNTEGWAFVSESGTVTALNGFSPVNYYPPRVNTLIMYQPNSSTSRAGFWYEDVTGLEGGAIYQASAYLASHRCSSQVYIDCYNAAGGNVGTFAVTASEGNAGTQQIGDFRRVFVNFTAPAGISYVRFHIIKNGTNTGTDSYVWFFRPQFTRIGSMSSPVVPYSSGGAGAPLVSADAKITQAATVAARADQAVGNLSTSVDTRFGGVNSTLSSYNERITALSTADQGFVSRFNTLESQMGGGTESTLFARIRGTESALTNLPNQYATVQRVNELAAQIGSGPSDLNATIDQRATVIADAKAGAVAQTVNDLTGRYNGTVQTVSQQAGVILDLQGKSSSYVRFMAMGPGGRAQFSLWSDQYGGAWELTGDGRMNGNVIIDGTLKPAKIDTPSLSAISGNIGSLVSYNGQGGRVERDGNGTRVYANNGNLVVKIGF